ARVKTARREGGEGQAAGHRAWHQAGSGRRTVAELTLGVAAPAVRHSGAGETARVRGARGDGGERESPGHGDRCGAARGGPIAELAVEPMPSWPSEFQPQQEAAPDPVSPQV